MSSQTMYVFCWLVIVVIVVVIVVVVVGTYIGT